MPSTSAKQARFMSACAHGWDSDACPPDAVAKKFHQADKKAKEFICKDGCLRGRMEEAKKRMRARLDSTASAIGLAERMRLNAELARIRAGLAGASLADKMRANKRIAEIRRALGVSASASDPQAFVQSPSGGVDFGRIEGDAALAIGQPDGPIRLQVGYHDDATGKGFGKVHIDRDLRAAQLAQNGYASSESLIEDVGQHFNVIYQGEPGTFILAKQNGKAAIAYVSVKPGGAVSSIVSAAAWCRAPVISRRSSSCGTGRRPVNRSPLAHLRASSMSLHKA